MSFNKIKISFLLILIGLLTLFGFKKNEIRIIESKDIHFIEPNFKFSSTDSVNKLLKQTNIFSNKILKSNLNLKDIEQHILSNNYFDLVDVSISVDGKLGIKIIEKNPVFRVLKDKYYIDANGRKMPLSSKFSKSVPLILNNVDSADLKILGEIGSYIEKNKFLNNHISSLSYKNEDLIFTLNDFSYSLNMRGFKGYNSKFKNYELFFLKVYNSGLLDSLTSINLNFKNQVIIQRK
jgi:cell division protein FtsQ